MISSQLRVVILTKIYYHDLGKNLPVVNLTEILAKIPVVNLTTILAKIPVVNLAKILPKILVVILNKIIAKIPVLKTVLPYVVSTGLSLFLYPNETLSSCLTSCSTGVILKKNVRIRKVPLITLGKTVSTWESVGTLKVWTGKWRLQSSIFLR